MDSKLGFSSISAPNRLLSPRPETPESSEQAFSLSGKPPESSFPDLFSHFSVRKNHIHSTLMANRTLPANLWAKVTVLARSYPSLEAHIMQSQTTQEAMPPAGPELQLYKEEPNVCEFDQSNESTDRLPQGLIDAFAAATGWELANVGNEIKIVDMSSHWPAKTPTAHRGNCDRIAEELSKLL